MVVTCDIDIHADPSPQYGFQNYINSQSMRKTRFPQRRPGCYGLLDRPLEETPIYKRYFSDKSEE